LVAGGELDKAARTLSGSSSHGSFLTERMWDFSVTQLQTPNHPRRVDLARSSTMHRMGIGPPFTTMSPRMEVRSR
jgi:hypothetical protein